MPNDDLSALEPWIAGMMVKLSPARRMALARKIGQALRRTNAARARANIEPDGSAMAPRKPRQERRRRQRIRERKAVRMFPKIELVRNMVIRPSPDQVELAFSGRVAATAAVHHYGLVDAVDRRIRNAIRVRYAARRLLGFSPLDREAIVAAAMALLDGKAP